jgi:hypothetical protein
VAAVGVGVGALLIAFFQGMTGGHAKDGPVLTTVGLACVGGGLATTATGLVLTLGNLHSDAKQSLDAPKPVALPAPRTVSLFSASF